MAFTFKQFHIDDLNCGMAVSTDAVVLGAWAPLTNAKQILDIGAGSGILGLMAAQRSQANITCIELDDTAAIACQHNIAQSPWASRIRLVQGSIQQLSQAEEYQGYFDHIICNPPYFEHGPQAQLSQRAMARHTDQLSFSELLAAIEQCLSSNGLASLILPIQSLHNFNHLLSQSKLEWVERVDIKSVEGKRANRVLCLLTTQTHRSVEPKVSELTLRDTSGQYSQAMVHLTQDFYLKL